ncbi:MAG: AAA family ATPase [Peptoniphilus sp.]|nr:AAA family ATPase [Peptoniphilus sp.]MDD7363793.1 AAA family ATPase [Bacillota bacterium]MDY6044634.1 AAA family ATPase [Peptoniphilus sp.]
MKHKQYVCTACGYKSSGYFSKCPNCGEWMTFEEVREEETKKTHASSSKPAKRLNEVSGKEKRRLKSGLDEFDRVMGGGIVEDGVSILAAKPGAGKSTLLFQIANALAKGGMNVVYASGEESETQIKMRAERISDAISDNIWIYAGTSMDDVAHWIRAIDADVIILDSIQTFTLDAFSARAGTPTQTMECANLLVDMAKNTEKPRAVFIVGQLTKQDSLAGVRALEHLVDTVLFIDDETQEELRILQATKNRFGSTGEMGFFRMTDRGMLSIDNPSAHFMTQREAGSEVPGSAMCIVREGTRSIIVEIESLVSKSFTPYPERISECLRREQLGILLSILEERGMLPLYDKNVVVKTTGNLRLKEGASHLAALMSIASALKNKPIERDILFIGDVGLTGELKPVPGMVARVKEAYRMGFRKIYTPPVAKSARIDGVELCERRMLKDVIAEIL